MTGNTTLTGNFGAQRDRFDVVVVGGGLSGLAAAWSLDDESVLVIEREPRPGGNAHLLDRKGLRYAGGAICFQHPIEGSLTSRMLHDIGLWGKWKDTHDDMVAFFDTRTLVRRYPSVARAVLSRPRALLDPRLYAFTRDFLVSLLTGRRVVKGPMALAGIVLEELFAYIGRFTPENGRYPDVPWTPDSAWSRQEMEALDSVSLHHVLFETGRRPDIPPGVYPDRPFGQLVADVVETTLRVECTSSKGLSAYTGLYFLVGYLLRSHIAFPGGNGYVAHRLADYLAERGYCQFQYGSTVTSIVPSAGHYRVDFTDRGRRRSVTAKSVVWAAPKFAAPSVVEGLPDRQLKAIASIDHRDYCVATVWLKRPVLAESFGGYIIDKGDDGRQPLGWCRPGVCFVNTWTDDAHRDKPGVLTLLMPIAGLSDQGRLARTDDRDIAERARTAVVEILNVSGESADVIDDIMIHRWDRSLVAPKIGQVAQQVFETASTPHGGVCFANQDRGGIGNAECAIQAGVAAAGEARTFIRAAAHAGGQAANRHIGQVR